MDRFTLDGLSCFGPQVPSLTFFYNLTSIFVLSQRHKFGMPQPVRLCPLQETQSAPRPRDAARRTPSFFRGQFIAPPRFVRAGQIDKGHRGRDKMANSLEDLPT